MTGHDDDERVADKRAASRMSDDGAPEAGQAPPAAGDPVSEAEARADANYKNWQRTAADFSNYRKRVESERTEMSRLAKAALVINLLPIYDDLDRASSTVDSHLAGLNWVQGVLAIHQKFSRLLEALDVRELSAAGEPFDPAQHEAIGQQPGPDGQVIHVAQKGYTLGEKVLRPAMVIIGDGSKTDQGANQR
jgi:molecular chaperone GrpE